MFKLTVKNRKRRLRKKLHLDEFQELGFYYRAIYKGDPNSKASEALIDDFLDFIISRGLEMAGWVEEGIIVKYKGSANEDDRQSIETWLKARPELDGVQLSPLCDTWYDTEEKVFP